MPNAARVGLCRVPYTSEICPLLTEYTQLCLTTTRDALPSSPLTSRWINQRIAQLVNSATECDTLFDALRIHYNIPMSDSLVIAGRSFRSRLIVGTGKYKSFQ